MKTLIITPIAAVLSAAALSPAIAESGQEDIVVSPSRAMEEWRGDVSRSLGRNLLLAERWAKHNPDSGLVQIRFQLDEDGRASNMQTYHSSGSVSTDRAAAWAVRRLNNLDEAPAGIAPGQTFQANIIFAESPSQKARYEEKLAYIERRRLASNASERGVIALGS